MVSVPLCLDATQPPLTPELAPALQPALCLPVPAAHSAGWHCQDKEEKIAFLVAAASPHHFSICSQGCSLQS